MMDVEGRGRSSRDRSHVPCACFEGLGKNSKLESQTRHDDTSNVGGVTGAHRYMTVYMAL